MSWSERKGHDLRGSHLYADWFFSQRADWLRSRGIDQAESLDPAGFIDSNFDINELYGGILVPRFMKNDSSDKPSGANEKTIIDKLPLLEPDTVIVGVIDTGIALGHRSTRLPDGTTRFIASWQQSATRKNISGDEFPNQSHPPFGRELFADDINTLLETHSIGGLEDGWLDEEAFNRAAGQVDFYNPLGHRELARRAAHGTHVVGRAAGYDVARDPALTKFADKMRIIAINLPSRDIVGLSGSFLEQYVGLGIARIVQLERLLVKRAKQETARTGIPDDELDDNFHFPVIINLSFGKQAGPRDGDEPIARLITEINTKPEKVLPLKNQQSKHWFDKILPIDAGGVFFTIPAGNDNLLQGNAFVPLNGGKNKDGEEKDGKERDLTWRILPEDQTPNFVEIWCSLISGKPSDATSSPLQISIDLPNGVSLKDRLDEKMWADLSAGNIYVAEIDQVVRVYCKVKHIKIEEFDESEGKKKEVDYYRLHYLICVAPTLVPDGNAPTAPAGVWRIRLTNEYASDLKINANVQTDQSAIPDGVTGLTSYFDDEAYVRVDETTGRLLDTYPYPDDEESALERMKYERDYKGNDENGSTVKRHGTTNALAIDRKFSIMVAGYRAKDGVPADYSASGGDVIGSYLGAPTLTLVTDDGPAHPGILSAGAHDGSAVAMRGTSFAAPQITRRIAELLVDGETGLNPKTWINLQSQSGYAPGEISHNEKSYSQTIDIDKGGRGRFPQAHYRGLNRLGLEEADD